MKRIVVAFLLLIGAAFPAFAVNPDEKLADPVLESRARALSAELRCMVCQNQSIDDSNAELARDLRILVRARLKAGDSDSQVLDYLVSRYGEFVLLKPRVNEHTLLLWGIPFGLALIAGGFVIFQVSRRRANVSTAELSSEEQEKLKLLINK
jgi:cytochrome c-type biogenesis protein CcmH